MNLKNVLNNLIEIRINKILEKQISRIKRSIPEMKKSIKDLEKKLSKISTVKKDERKPKKKSINKSVRKAKCKAKKTCSMKGCNKPMKAKGLCNAHYVAAFRKNKKS